MKTWTKTAAVDELTKLCNRINVIAPGHPFSSDHTHWMANVLRVFEEVFGQNSRYYVTFRAFTWQFHGATMVMTWELRDGRHPDEVMQSRHDGAYRQQLGSAHGLLRAAIDELNEAADIASVYEGTNTGPEASSILKIINLAERKFRKAIREKPKNEKVVQDAFETLLSITDIPYTREKVSFEYSSRSYRPDFVVETIDLAIELKICTSEEKERNIVQEMNDDILAYRTKFANILFVIYDLGFIRDVDRLCDAFGQYEDVVIRVVKH